MKPHSKDLGPVAVDSAIWSGHYLAAEALRYDLVLGNALEGYSAEHAQVCGLRPPRVVLVVRGVFNFWF